MPAITPGDASASNGAAEGSLDALISPLAGADVFILFDTSNYMYRGFVFAQDAVANFVRSLDGPDRVAFYAYSRDLLRASTLSKDRLEVLRGVRQTVAGADAALYDALLLTLRDAGQLTGRKAIVVFSNGPDNISVAPPEDVRELAQSEGVPIYMISTREAKIEPISTAVFQRITGSTGGQVYFAKSWQEEEKAFASIREDLAHVYSIFYYPQPNPNRGWRALKIKLADPKMNKYVIRTRTGLPPPDRAAFRLSGFRLEQLAITGSTLVARLGLSSGATLRKGSSLRPRTPCYFCYAFPRAELSSSPGLNHHCEFIAFGSQAIQSRNYSTGSATGGSTAGASGAASSDSTASFNT